VVERFLKGYRTATVGCASVPLDEGAFRALLNLFTLEKALYEVVYEATNRPDWIGIPAQGVQRVLAAAG
jgi:maltose alpha-D-glucosyltransferase/alpha-amylase